MRGEYPLLSYFCFRGFGSSPRAWGIPPRSAAVTGSNRFIPTCVGNTSAAESTAWGKAVHPHVRGEYVCPASAPKAWWTVHPHVRGEYDGIERTANGVDGSSPRAWGIHYKLASLRMGERFIPTCVGNTAGPQEPFASHPVHPHVRGEYPLPWPRLWPLVGSSPRAWGIPPTARGRHYEQRFIPTCVGNTPSLPTVANDSPVHPHVRGEYSVWPAYSTTGNGSSPRAWGILRTNFIEQLS